MIKRFAAPLALAFALAACGGGGEPAETADSSVSADAGTPDGAQPADAGPQPVTITPGCFTAKNPATPLIGFGALRTEATWNDPHVMKTASGGYVMYASAKDSFTGPAVHIFRMVSDDGYAWTLEPETPVLSPPEGSHGVETPVVVKFADTYHLFYTFYPGENDPTSYSVGHATSDDGIAFTVSDHTLITSTGVSSHFNGMIVGEPGAVVVGDQLHVYFTAVGIDQNGQGNQSIGLVTSADGKSYSAAEKVLELDRTVFPRAAGWFGLSTPSAVVAGGEVHLFTDVASDADDPVYGEGWRQVGLFHASSADGRTDWSSDTELIHEVGDFPWAARELRSVTPLLDDGTLRIWYAGDQLWTFDDVGERVWHTDRWGIGTSECAL